MASVAACLASQFCRVVPGGPQSSINMTRREAQVRPHSSHIQPSSGWVNNITCSLRRVKKWDMKTCVLTESRKEKVERRKKMEP